MSICNSLRLTRNMTEIPARAVFFDPRRDINIYETLCLYFAENNINPNDIDDEEFNDWCSLIEIYKEIAAKEGHPQMAFWIH